MSGGGPTLGCGFPRSGVRVPVLPNGGLLPSDILYTTDMGILGVPAALVQAIMFSWYLLQGCSGIGAFTNTSESDQTFMMSEAMILSRKLSSRLSNVRYPIR